MTDEKRPKLSREKAREMGKKGGVASGAARRARRGLREGMRLLLEMPVQNANDLEQLAALGIPAKGVDHGTMVVVALYKKAAGGDLASIREVLELAGEGEGGLENEQLKAVRELLGSVDSAI